MFRHQSVILKEFNNNFRNPFRLYVVADLYIKTNKYTCIKYFLSRIINYQHVSNVFAIIIIIIRVALQGY